MLENILNANRNVYVTVMPMEGPVIGIIVFRLLPYWVCRHFRAALMEKPQKYPYIRFCNEITYSCIRIAYR